MTDSVLSQFETDRFSMGHHVDGLKFAGGSFSLFPEDKLNELINLAHEHNVYVSTVSFLPQIANEY